MHVCALMILFPSQVCLDRGLLGRRGETAVIVEAVVQPTEHALALASAVTRATEAL